MVYLVKIYLGNKEGMFHLNDGFLVGNFVEFPLYFEVGSLSKSLRVIFVTDFTSISFYLIHLPRSFTRGNVLILGPSYHPYPSLTCNFFVC
jgi:hypothetical protein